MSKAIDLANYMHRWSALSDAIRVQFYESQQVNLCAKAQVKSPGAAVFFPMAS